MYIAEGRNGRIRKFTCDGELTPDTEFAINIAPEQVFNLTSIGNTLYSAWGFSWDVCTGLRGDDVCFNGLPNGVSVERWGLWWDEPSGYFYTSFRIGADPYTGIVYRFRPEDYGTGVCIDPFIESGTNAIPAVGANTLPNYGLQGIATDNNGNIYIVYGGYIQNGALTKYDSNGNFIGISTIDTAEDGTGYWGSYGVIYSETCDCLYMTTLSGIEDCVSVFDTDLNYLGAAVPASGDTGQGQDPFSTAKAIGIVKECCPSEPLQSFNESICLDGTDVEVFIQDVYDCDGIVCEGGIWQSSSLDATVSYDECSQSVTLSGAGGCGTFTKTSDGMGATSQCPAFRIDLTICFYIQPPAPVISVTDNTCDPNVAGSINIDTPCAAGSTIEFSIDGGLTWSTTQPAYDATASVTLRARCANILEASCNSAETADVRTAPEECCPPVNCINQYGPYTIIKNEP